MLTTLAPPLYPCRRLAILVVALAVITMSVPTGGEVVAQEPLTLADFDSAGKEVELLALIEAGPNNLINGIVLLYQASPRTPPAGTLVDGELGIGPDNAVVTRMRLRQNLEQIQINHSTGGFSLQTYLGVGGAGSDLTGHFQSPDGSVTFPVAGQSSGSGYASFDYPQTGHNIVTGIATGARFILAFYRDLPPPAQVSGVQASALSDTEIRASWPAAANADGYLVQWTSVGQSFDEIRQASVTGTSHRITGLDYSTEYLIRVTATRTGAVDGPPSDPPATATTNAPPAPPRVSGVQASARSETEIRVSWSGAADADGYLVQWGTAGQPFDAARQASVTGTSHTIAGLEYNTEYFIQVSATRIGAVNGPPSKPANARTNPLPAPEQVSGVQASARSDIEVRVSWSAAANADGYLVQWAIGGQSFDDVRRASVTGTNHTITGLEYSTEYFTRVTATRTGAVNGPPSDPPATATTTAAPTPAQVSGVVASALSDAEVSVSWSPAPNATAYVVEWRPDGESHAGDRRAVVMGTEVVIEDLESETDYFIRVFGTRKGAANGDASAEDTAVTLESAIKSAIKRFPGGNEIAMQLSLVGFAGVLSGVRFRGKKSPQREAMILGFMCAASLILPIIGIGSLFWTGGIILLIAAASAAAYFLMSR